MSQHVTVRLRFTSEAARIVTPGAPRDLQMDAARGALALPPGDLLPVLLVFCRGADAQLRSLSIATVKGLPTEALAPVASDPATHPQVLDLVARIRIHDPALMRLLIGHPAIPATTLQWLAAHGDASLLDLLAGEPRIAALPEIKAAILGNPHADSAIRRCLGEEAEEPTEVNEVEEPLEDPASEKEADDPETEGDEEAEPEEEINLSKYQQALEMEVAEKIKMALTGDKEWRTIFTKDSNKLVNSAVLKNPRITDGEVLAIAKNKGSNDEMIRLITMNREWIKKYEVQKALILHARTPLPKALRYMNVLTEKDLKVIAKSRGVAQVIVNNARRMLAAKNKKK